VYEVVRALAQSAGTTMDDVAHAADGKAAERGAFADRLFLVALGGRRLKA
jgi:hypothetical protein